MSLESILEAVAKGKIAPTEAKEQIKKFLDGNKSSSAQDEVKSEASQEESAETKMESLKGAFDKFKKSVHFDELLKKSSGMVSQIADSMPKPIADKLSKASTLNNFAFSSQTRGVESKLSIFRAFQSTDDSAISDNQVVGSQWFGVDISDSSEMKNNRFTAVQMSELAISKSNLNTNAISLSRLSNLSFTNSKFTDNKVARSTYSDVTLSDSQFVANRVNKTGFARTVLNESRVTNNTFFASDISDCEFEHCDIQDLEFENCSFRECTFSGLSLQSRDTSNAIRNIHVQGKTVSGCKTIESFLEALAKNSDTVVANETQTSSTPAETVAIEKVEPAPSAVTTAPNASEGNLSPESVAAQQSGDDLGEANGADKIDEEVKKNVMEKRAGAKSSGTKKTKTAKADAPKEEWSVPQQNAEVTDTSKENDSPAQ